MTSSSGHDGSSGDRSSGNDVVPTDHRRLDGNAAAGPLSELFAVDLVAALSTCAHCASIAPLAEHTVYADAPAIVVRCPSCTGVVLRYSNSGGRLRIDFSGAALLVLDL